MSREAGFFLLGLLAPFLMLTTAAWGVVVLRAVFEFVGWGFRFRRNANDGERVRAASIVYGAEKIWIFAIKDFAILFTHGIDHKKRFEAVTSLNKRRAAKITDDFKKRMAGDGEV